MKTTVKGLLRQDIGLRENLAELHSQDQRVRQEFKSRARAQAYNLEYKAAQLAGAENKRHLSNLANQWREELADIVYVLRTGGPSLLDLCVDSNEIHILVNGPGMSFEYLNLLTSLALADGYSVDTLATFTEEIEIVAHCGHVGTTKIVPKQVPNLNSVQLQIGLGPMSMYESELILETKSGETFIHLIERTIAQFHTGKYLVALAVISGTSHHASHTPGHHDEHMPDPHGHSGHNLFLPFRES